MRWGVLGNLPAPFSLLDTISQLLLRGRPLDQPSCTAPGAGLGHLEVVFRFRPQVLASNYPLLTPLNHPAGSLQLVGRGEACQ